MQTGRLNPLNEFSGYADLPDEVLQEVLGRTAEVADAVRTLFTRVDERRESMRIALEAQGVVRDSARLPAVSPPAVAAVDGGAAIDKAIGADTALAVAVGIEGLTQSPTPQWPGVQYAAWQKTLPHAGEETAATCRGVMTALELSVLRSAPHEVVLLDGSHLTPVIALNAMLSVTHEALRDEIAAAVTRFDTADALLAVMDAPAVVAIVKYDGSRDLSQTFLRSETSGGSGPGLDDRTILSLLLESGEYTAPQPIALTQQSKNNWLSKRIETLTPSDAAREAVRVALNGAVQRVREDRLFATYFKPHPWSPAFRLEIKPEVAVSPERLSAVLTALRTQVVSPEIREPYPQWVADRMAKSVGDALIALRAAVNFDLADRGLGEYVALIAHSYRTEAMP